MEALALTALGDAVLKQTGDTERAQELIDRALELQEEETDVDAHFDSLMVRVGIGVTRGSMAEADAVHRAGLRRRARRRPQGPPDDRLAGAGPGAHRPARVRQGRASHPQGARAGRPRAAARARGGRQSSPSASSIACGRSTTRPRRRTRKPASSSRRSATPRCSRYSLSRMADVAFEKGDLKRSEKLLRESIRLLAPLGQHRELAESQAELGTRARGAGQDRRGRALRGRGAGVPPLGGAAAAAVHRARSSRRADAQERQDEAEELFVEALAITDEVDFTALEAEVLRRIVRFLDESRAER